MNGDGSAVAQRVRWTAEGGADAVRPCPAGGGGARSRRHLVARGGLYSLLAAGLVACARSDAGGQATGNATLAPATLRFMGQDAATDVKWHQGAVARFNARYPHVQATLELRPFANTPQVVSTLLAAGDPPDVIFQAARHVIGFYQQKAILRLDDLVKGDRTTVRSDFYPHALDDQSWRGALFGIPTAGSGQWMFFNETMFARAGRPSPIELDRAGRWNWASFLDAAKALTRDSGDDKPEWGYPLRDWDFDWPCWIWQHGGEVLDKDRTRCLLDQPAAVEALQWHADLRLKQRVAPPAPDPGQPATEFDTGRMAMQLAAPGSIQAFRRATGGVWSFDVAPPLTDKHKVTTGAGAGTSIFSATKARDQAWRFVAEYVGDETAVVMVRETGRMPLRASQFEAWLETLNHTKEPPRNAAIQRDILRTVTRTVPYTPSWDAWRKVIGDEIFTPVWSGRRTAADAVLAAVPKINQILAADG